MRTFNLTKLYADGRANKPGQFSFLNEEAAQREASRKNDALERLGDDRFIWVVILEDTVGEYIIACETLTPDGERLFWSREHGWADRASATTYTWRERYEGNLSLPEGGVWWVIR